MVPCSLTFVIVSKTCSTSTGARPIDGSSSSSNRGRAMSARPIASICCSPPDKRSRLLREAFLQAREQIEDPIHVGRDLGLVVAQEGSELEILGDRHPREDPPALWALGNASLRNLVTLQARDPLAFEVNLAALWPQQPGDRAHRGRLAGTVAADERDDLARSLSPKKSAIKFFTLGPPSYIICDPSFVFVWLSKTGSCTLILMAAQMLPLISAAS